MWETNPNILLRLVYFLIKLRYIYTIVMNKYKCRILKEEFIMEFKIKVFKVNVDKLAETIFSKYGGLQVEDLSISTEIGKDGKVAVITGTVKNENTVRNYFRNLSDFKFNNSKFVLYFYKEVEMETMSYDPYDYMERSGSKMLW